MIDFRLLNDASKQKQSNKIFHFSICPVIISTSSWIYWQVRICLSILFCTWICLTCNSYQSNINQFFHYRQIDKKITSASYGIWTFIFEIPVKYGIADWLSSFFHFTSSSNSFVCASFDFFSIQCDSWFPSCLYSISSYWSVSTLVVWNCNFC